MSKVSRSARRSPGNDAAPTAKGKMLSRLKSSSLMGASWTALLFGFAFCVVFAATLLLSQVFDDAVHPSMLVRGSFMPYAMHVLSLKRSRSVEITPYTLSSAGLLSVLEIVSCPGDIMLFVRVVENSILPRKESLECVFGRGKERTPVLSSDWKDPHKVLMVRCPHPSSSLSLITYPTVSISRFVTLGFRNVMRTLPSKAQYPADASWKSLTYESLTEADSVLLFVKGLLDSHGKPNNYSRSLHKLSCVFGGGGHDIVKTRVRSIAQEVVRCDLPAAHMLDMLQERQVTLSIPKVGKLPSVAYFDANESFPSTAGERKHYLCSCTMVWNQAPFLKEWIMYHGFLGVERFFLYDNNSDDDIEEVLSGPSMGAYNVSRHGWPWIKTQEAGFSHCALRARSVCEWVMFTDVDEFIYPKQEMNYKSSVSAKRLSKQIAEGSFRNESSSVTILKRLIQRHLREAQATRRRLGELRIMCHNFGPSGLNVAPEEGVMVGYSCRMKWPERHKSLLYLNAMSDTMLNVVHHFALKEGFSQMAVRPRVAVVNHYKYQAWDVFKAKFVRRVATYVVDWQDEPGESRDRVPGLGSEPVRPLDWPQRFCEEEDVGLRNFTLATFRDHRTQRMLWQL